MEYMEKALAELDNQIATLQQTRHHMAAALGRGSYSSPSRAPRSSATTTGTRTRKPMSEDAKQKIRDAQKKRWAGHTAAGDIPAGVPAPAQPTTLAVAKEAIEQKPADKPVEKANTTTHADKKPEVTPAKKK